MNNNPEIIEYGYVYIHTLFESTMNEDLWRTNYDEVRDNGEDHAYFTGRLALNVIEMPTDRDNFFRFIGDLEYRGIPFFADYSCTEEYSMYTAFATNEICTQAHFSWTSLNTKKETKITKLDPKFFNEFSKLRAAHIKLNKGITYEESLNAYYSSKRR